MENNIELKKVLKLKDLVFYGMIMMVLIAPMAVYGEIEHASEGMTPLVYIVGMICMLFTALSYKSMSEEFPIGGSVYAYVQHGVNHHVGFIAGWMILLDYIFVPALLYVLVSQICAATFPGVPAIVWVIGFIVINCVINIRGVEYTAGADLILFIIELVTVVIFIIAGIRFVLNGGGTGAFVADPIYQPGKINLNFIASACTIAALSFLGFDGISTLAGEAVNPKKDIGKAIIISLLCISLIFVIETYVACLILPDWESTALGDGFYDAAALAVGEWFRIALVFITILAAGIANTLVAQSSAARLLYSMGRDRVMPPIFGKLHPKYKTPYMGILILAGFSFIITLIIPPATLTRLVTLGAMSSFIMLNAAVFIYFIIRKKRTDIKGILKYGLLPIIGVFILCYIFTGFDKVSYIVGGAWLVIGILIGAIQSKGYKIVPEGFKNIEM